MSYSSAFSPDYKTARNRFRAAGLALGCDLEAYSIEEIGPDGEELTIDVAMLGNPKAQKVVVVSSGLHGVEGFFGSAVQCALLEERLKNWKQPADLTLLLLHALNPYGFAWLRRWNEDNVDLNRNFLLPGEEYRGSPQMYGDLNVFFNPSSPPSRFEPFLLKAIALILRYGINSLTKTLPVGQYDFPQGLFFGGHAPAKTYRILDANLSRWMGEAKDVVHVDLHTGLGQKATYKLFIEDPPESESTRWLTEKFGANYVEPYQTRKVAYKFRGGLGNWCQAKLPQSNYRYLTAEFGTYSVIQVVEALRAENRAHFFAPTNHPCREWTSQRLKEVFVPGDKVWRDTVVAQGLDLVERAIASL